jgi:hypothetical protein
MNFEDKYCSIPSELLSDFLNALSSIDEYLYEAAMSREDCKQLGKYEYLKGKLSDVLTQNEEN